MTTVTDNFTDVLADVNALADFMQARVEEQDRALQPHFDAESKRFDSPAVEQFADHLFAVEEIITRARSRAKWAKTTQALSEAVGLGYALRAHAVAFRDHPDYRAQWSL